MPNASGGQICWSFKQELLQAIHCLGGTTVARSTTGPDTIKAALYLTTANIGPATTVYSPTGEVSGPNYSPGGIVVPNATPPQLQNGVAYWSPSAAFTWTGITEGTAFDSVLFYNASQGNRALCTWQFGSTTITTGSLTLIIPTILGHSLIEVA